MTTSFRTSSVPGSPAARGGEVPETAPHRLILRCTEDGWVLLSHDGQIVFHGVGLPGRQQCLEFARDHGVVSVLSS
jgi:hypothetical protein